MYHKRFIKYIFLAVLLLFVIFIFVITKQDKSLPIAPWQKEAVPTEVVLPGKLFLVSKETAKTYIKGQEVHLLVYANSAGQSVAGFDTVLEYDSNIVEFVSAKSLVDSFTVSAQTKDGKVYVMGMKGLAEKMQTAFEETVICEVVFKTLEEGQTDVSLEFVQGQTTDSNLMNESGKDILGSVEGLSLVVGGEKTLFMNIPLEIENGIKATLTDLSLSDPACIDCVNSVVIVLTGSDVQSQRLTFSQGGIEGKVDLVRSAFGVRIEIVEFGDNWVKVNIMRF